MSKLRLHQRYDKLIIAVAFVLIMVTVIGSCSWATVKLKAEETVSAETQGDNSESLQDTTPGAGQTQTSGETQGETGSSTGSTETESSSEVKVYPTATVKEGVTGVRIRSSIDTSSTANVIASVNGGLKLEILETIKVSDTYIWYKVNFYNHKKYQFMEGYISGEYVVLDKESDYTEEMDFEKYLDSQGFPESYKPALRELHKKYPKWVFVADHLNMTWQEMVDKQSVPGRALISINSISSWKSTELKYENGGYSSPYFDWVNNTWYGWDGANWVQASSELLKYTLDPRNFIDDKHIFMFEELSYDNAMHTLSGVEGVFSNTYYATSDHDLTYNDKKFSYAQAVLYAGQVSKVSPYHLASRIIQEQGSSASRLGQSISGTVAGYEGFYNYYNISAYAHSGNSAIVNGLIYASNTTAGTYLRPWNTRMKAIIGGAIYIGQGYIYVGQDTIYYEKYDAANFYGYAHQYMSHVLAPRSESEKVAKAYSEEMKQNTAMQFFIPVYKNMPEQICPIPTKDGNPNNTLSSLSVEGHTITPSFSKFVTEYDLIVENAVATVNIQAALAHSSAKITGNGSRALAVGDNKIEIVVTAENGDVRTYNLNIVRKEGTKEPETESASGGSSESSGSAGETAGGTETGTQGSSTEVPTVPKNQYDLSAYKPDDAKCVITGFGIGDTAQKVLENVKVSSDVTVAVLKSDGSANTGVIGTGNKLVLYMENGNVLRSYDIVIYGDVTGDGAISLTDIVRLRQYLLGNRKLEGAYVEAADCTKNGDVGLADIVRIRRHLLGLIVIEQ